MRLDEVHREIHRLATMLNDVITKLNNSKHLTNITEQVLERGEQRRQYRNMKNCLKIAADITTTASTTYDADHQDSRTQISDLRDLFKEESSSLTDDWVKKMRDANLHDAPIPRLNNFIPNEPQSAEEWDSDDEDDEIIEALHKDALQKLKEKDKHGASRSLQNCVDRIDNHAGLHKLRPNIADIRLSSLITLISIAREQEDWDTAQKRLRQKITILAGRSQVNSGDSSIILDDTVLLSEVLLSKKDYVQSLGYGRKALKLIKKRKPINEDEHRTVLDLLVRICVKGNMQADADGYQAVINHRFSPRPPHIGWLHNSWENILNQRLTNEQDQTLKKEMEMLATSHSQMKTELEQECLRSSKVSLLWREHHKDTISKLREEHNVTLSKLRADNLSVVSEMEKKLDAIKFQHETEMTSLSNKLAKAESENSKEISNLKYSHSLAMTGIAKFHRDELVHVQRRLDSQHGRLTEDSLGPRLSYYDKTYKPQANDILEPRYPYHREIAILQGGEGVYKTDLHIKTYEQDNFKEVMEGIHLADCEA
jgi:hypothetical protein